MSKGANIEARDERGITLLAAALESIKEPHFGEKVVEMLIQFGADPNATDDQGQTCISRAGGNQKIYQLRIHHGATVTPSAMTDAISSRDKTLLEAMLIAVWALTWEELARNFQVGLC